MEDINKVELEKMMANQNIGSFPYTELHKAESTLCPKLLQPETC
jgi:hypothetical protein